MTQWYKNGNPSGRVGRRLRWRIGCREIAGGAEPWELRRERTRRPVPAEREELLQTGSLIAAQDLTHLSSHT
ncbi:hypothetical protein Y1Q_0009678 [Alligator mississippiensis]|uniref:Uncharacterized protein n=1 Tax=Alligator mississippiensis TaxID=8496 RepID=A0A151NDE9_ALLMI|nr:hypothetical protein Y1Q_0009678 [Alligator mississippiensis]